MDFPILSALVVLPGVGALLVALVGKRRPELVQLTALVSSVVVAGLAIWMLVDFQSGEAGFQFVSQHTWIEAWGISWHLGVDGIGVTALFVTSIVTLLVVLRERTVPRGAAGYHAALLVLDAASIGAVTAMDGLLFVLFSSIAIVTAGLLVGTWGGDGRRSAAMRLMIPGLGAILLLVLAFAALARHPDPTFLVDGTSARTRWPRSISRAVRLRPMAPMSPAAPVTRMGREEVMADLGR